MGWDRAARNARLNGTRRQQRAGNDRILRNHGNICHVCRRPGADEVDHVIALAEGGLDVDANKRPIHAKPCHQTKTNLEAARGRQRSRQRSRRTAEPHPGLHHPLAGDPP